jgi:hypothetical protein
VISEVPVTVYAKFKTRALTTLFTRHRPLSGLLRHSILTRTILKLLHPRLSIPSTSLHYTPYPSLPLQRLFSNLAQRFTISILPTSQNRSRPKESYHKAHATCEVHDSSSMSYPGTFPYGSGHQQVLDR